MVRLAVDLASWSTTALGSSLQDLAIADDGAVWAATLDGVVVMR